MKVQKLKDGRFRDAATGVILKDAPQKVVDIFRSQVRYMIKVYNTGKTNEKGKDLYSAVLTREGKEIGKTGEHDSSKKAGLEARKIFKQKTGSPWRSSGAGN